MDKRKDSRDQQMDFIQILNDIYSSIRNLDNKITEKINSINLSCLNQRNSCKEELSPLFDHVEEAAAKKKDGNGDGRVLLPSGLKLL